jgi:peroxin-2
LRCGEEVKECKPWNGDVLDEFTKTSSSKSVGFSEDVSKPLTKLQPFPEEDATKPEEVIAPESNSSSTTTSVMGETEAYDEEEEGVMDEEED